MRILAALKGSFPELSSWQPGYAPVVEAINNGRGHSPEAADKQGQGRLASVGCQYVDDQFLPALRATGHFVDQELFRP